MSAGAKAGLSIAIFLAINGLLVFFSSNYYLWAKSFHLVAMVSWMVGLFYMPRIFVYHADAKKGSDKALTFELMEKRLMKIIMTPAMILTWGFGFYLIIQFGDFPLWLWLKLLCVIGLTLFHFMLAGALKKLREAPDYKTSNQWRIYNEIPTLLMIVAIIMVVVRPF